MSEVESCLALALDLVRPFFSAYPSIRMACANHSGYGGVGAALVECVVIVGAIRESPVQRSVLPRCSTWNKSAVE